MKPTREEALQKAHDLWKEDVSQYEPPFRDGFMACFDWLSEDDGWIPVEKGLPAEVGDLKPAHTEDQLKAVYDFVKQSQTPDQPKEPKPIRPQEEVLKICRWEAKQIEDTRRSNRSRALTSRKRKPGRTKYGRTSAGICRRPERSSHE